MQVPNSGTPGLDFYVGGVLSVAGVDSAFKWMPYQAGINMGNPELGGGDGGDGDGDGTRVGAALGLTRGARRSGRGHRPRPLCARIRSRHRAGVRR